MVTIIHLDVLVDSLPSTATMRGHQSNGQYSARSRAFLWRMQPQVPDSKVSLLGDKIDLLYDRVGFLNDRSSLLYDSPGFLNDRSSLFYGRESLLCGR